MSLSKSVLANLGISITRTFGPGLSLVIQSQARKIYYNVIILRFILSKIILLFCLKSARQKKGRAPTAQQSWRRPWFREQKE